MKIEIDPHEYKAIITALIAKEIRQKRTAKMVIQKWEGYIMSKRNTLTVLA